jgi:glucose-6-phosphate 1-epimerase
MVASMHINTPDVASTQRLEQLVAKTDFLRLTTSNAHYTNAMGAGLPLLIVETALCSAVISLQGAHLLEFKTTEGDPLLWLSPNCDFTPGAALRGGVPLCLPWFGVNQAYPDKPKHGFARNSFWELGEAHLLSDGAVELEFLFLSDANELFPYDFSAELRITLGTSAKLELTINNTDTEDFDCSWAMHNYHRISSLTDVRVLGLAERTYLDNFENYAAKHQSGDVSFTGPVDRVYPAIDNSVRISGSPSIEITHSDCPSVVVWNPGQEAAAKIADIGEGQEQFYICVERGAVLSEKWHLTAGTSKSAWMEFKQV